MGFERHGGIRNHYYYVVTHVRNLLFDRLHINIQPTQSGLILRTAHSGLQCSDMSLANGFPAQVCQARLLVHEDHP